MDTQAFPATALQTTLFSLAGRVAVVTGLAGNLGPFWAESLLGAGATVFGIDLPGQSSAAIDALRDRFGEDRVELVPGDVTDRATLTAALDRCLERFGAPHVLLNNAGIDQPPDPLARNFRLEDVPFDDALRVLKVNSMGTFLCMQVFGQAMIAERRGSIINIGSLYAAVAPDETFYDHIETDPPFLKPPAYGASKAAVVNLSRYFATAWGKHNVRVNTLSPGGVFADQDPRFVRKFAARTPLGRMCNREELAGPLLFLASDASTYVTGIELRVDGGFTAW